MWNFNDESNQASAITENLNILVYFSQFAAIKQCCKDKFCTTLSYEVKWAQPYF